jgi:hypothetical protein
MMFIPYFFLTSIWNVAASNIDYQIHSYNDLLEWDQIIIKGARRFKVDPHFVTSSECKKAGISNDHGCFLLNHDRPYPEKAKYNSSNDLLNYLSSATFARLSNQEPISVALCFKDAPDKCDFTSSSFNSWLTLVNDFHAQATQLAANSTSPIASVEFVLDGDAKPSGCLAGMWKPWVSVWINSDGPQDAFWSDNVEVRMIPLLAISIY